MSKIDSALDSASPNLTQYLNTSLSISELGSVYLDIAEKFTQDVTQQSQLSTYNIIYKQG